MIIDLTDAAVRESAPRDPASVMRAVSDADSPIDAIPHAASAGMLAPTRVIRPDVLADGLRAAGQAESARHPGAIAMPPRPSIAEGTGSPTALRPLPAPADGPPSAVAEEYDFLWGSTQTRSVADAAIRASGRRPPTRILGIWCVRRRERRDRNGHNRTALAPASGAITAAGRGVLIDAMPWGPGPGELDENGENGFTVKRGNLAGPDTWAARPPDKIGPAVPALLCPAGHVNPPSEARCRRCGASLPPDPVRATAGARRAPAIGRRHDLA